MKKLLIFAIAALGMLACTDKNAPSSESKDIDVVEGEIGDIIGCWAPADRCTYYYEFRDDGYCGYYGNTFGSSDITILKYTEEKYISDAYLDNPWVKNSDAPYQYDPTNNLLTIYEGLTTTVSLEWIDGSHVYVKNKGEYVRINPQTYVRGFFKSKEKDYEKDFSEIKAAHQTHFFIRKDYWIRFSPGNLQYQASTNTWRFAEHQYDIIGSANANISNSYTGWIDLFGWGTGNNPTLASKAESDYSAFTDWGENAISNGGNQPNQWRTLKEDELDSIFSNTQKGHAIVASVHGVILLPEFWVTPSGLTFQKTLNWTTNQYSVEDWSKMESVGAIFLPAAGARQGTEFEGINPDIDYYFGGYWARENLIYFDHQAYYLSRIANVSRETGLSVRLIQTIE